MTARRVRDRRRRGMPKEQPVVGVVLIMMAVAYTLVNVSDVISDLKDWHGVSQPSVVGPILKQVGTTIVSAIGGRLLPRRGV